MLRGAAAPIWLLSSAVKSLQEFSSSSYSSSSSLLEKKKKKAVLSVNAIKISPSCRFKVKLIKIFTQSSRYCIRQGFCGVLIAAGAPRASPEPRGANPELVSPALVPTGTSHCPCGASPCPRSLSHPALLPVRSRVSVSSWKPCTSMEALYIHGSLVHPWKLCTSMELGLGARVLTHRAGLEQLKAKQVQTCSPAQRWTGQSLMDPGLSS